MTKKEIAQNFLIKAASGNSREAFKLYVDKSFKHHNAYFKGDGDTLMIAMEESAKQNPDKIFQIQRIIHEGNLVAAHSYIKQNQADLGAAVIHIFRFKADKIVELWDFGQALPEKIINENGMF